jgi:transposase
VLETVGERDLVDFYRAYRLDGHGRAAHDPEMMVALPVCAYAVGVRSSRGIERRCREDVAFRLIAVNQTPDHATIARFRVRHERAIGDLFAEVLRLCAKAGLVKVGIVAVDGTKIAAAATHHQNRSYEQIAQEILKEAAETDAAEDELYGEARGDELPEGFGTQTERRARLREAKLALEAEREAKAKPVPRDRGERLKACRAQLQQNLALERRVEAEHEAWREAGIARNGRRCMNPHNYRSKVLPEIPPARSMWSTRTAATSRPREVGCRATTHRRLLVRARSCSPPKSVLSRSIPATSNRWSRPPTASSPRPA